MINSIQSDIFYFLSRVSHSCVLKDLQNAVKNKLRLVFLVSICKNQTRELTSMEFPRSNCPCSKYPNSWKLLNTMFPEWSHFPELQFLPKDDLSISVSSLILRQILRLLTSPTPGLDFCLPPTPEPLMFLPSVQPNLSQQAGWHLFCLTVCFFVFQTWPCPDSP